MERIRNETLRSPKKILFLCNNEKENEILIYMIDENMMKVVKFSQSESFQNGFLKSSIYYQNRV